MLISFDSQTFFSSKIRSFNKKNLSKKLSRYSYPLLHRSTSGPKNFMIDLIQTIEINNLADTTINFFNSDTHILNAGFYSFIWGKTQPKNKKRVIIRLDGIGLDSENINLDKVRSNFIRIIKRGSFLVYQSKFSKNCFNNTYNSLPPGKVIYNGSVDLGDNIFKSTKFLSNINDEFNGEFYALAGRFSSRKRIYEITKEFNKYNLGNLVVMSNVPNELKFKNKRIIYLGMINSELARIIIASSLGLIHFDRYDWCPNIVVGAVSDGIPVICSNYGGTPEIVGQNGLIIKEFPDDLSHNLEGINYTKSSPFPGKLFRENFTDRKWKKLFRKKENCYNIKDVANKYVNIAYNLLKS